jgi:uncharacterized protein (DUF1800 family)
MAAPATAVSNASVPSSYRPGGALDIGSALAPYRGRWTAREAAHLLRRAGFGGSPDDVARLAGGSMSAAVDGLVRFADTAALPAQPELAADTPRALLQAQNVASMLGTGNAISPEVRQQLAQGRRRNVVALQSWFLDRMIASPAPLQEKMTLFWHGHFTSAYEKGIPAHSLVDQNNLYRTFALGNLRELTQRVSQDPAMLRYLDNAQNVKAHPNENYARELMELFTLGIGNYTETDVRESARAFTGWTINPTEWTFVDNQRQHDAAPKTFLGRTGDLSGYDIVQTIFAQPAAARWFANKLLNFFVYNDPEPALIDGVAALLRKSDFNVQPVVSTLLRSNIFYSTRAYRALVKSPVEYVVGAYQLYGFKQSDPIALFALRRMGQVLFYPPNVKGWEGGAQWLNSQALLTRANFASSLMTKMNDATWLGGSMRRSDPAQLARTLTRAILQDDVSPEAVDRLQAYLGGRDVAAMGMLSVENVDERVRGAAYLTMAMPAYQLA